MKRNIKYSIVPAILIALFIVLGYGTKVNKGFRVSFGGVGALMLLTAGVIFAISLIYSGIDVIVLRETKKKDLGDLSCGFSILTFAFCAFALIVMWTPLFLAFYPGLFAYDAQWQYFMYVNNEISNHQPILHTYLLGYVIDKVNRLTGSINKGIAAYTLVQMIIVLLGCAYVPYKMRKLTKRKWISVLTLLIYGLFPVITIFVFTSTKDTFFAVAIADLVILLFEFIKDGNVFWNSFVNRILFVLFVLEILVLRNNAIYPFLIVFPFFVMMIIKGGENKGKALITILFLCVFYLVIKYPLTNALATEKVSKAEMLSVPCQQIMRVYKYHYDELGKEEIEKVEMLFDSEKWYGYYVPEIADATKGSLRIEEYEKDSTVYWNLWITLLKKYPNEYVDSVLENTYAFWYPWPHYIIYSFGGEGYTPILTMQPGEQNSKLPKLLSLYKNFENGAIVQSAGWISWLFAPATYMYIALITLFYLLKEKRYKVLLVFGFLILLWCTYLLGPVAMVRYALYLYTLLPVWFVYVFGGINGNDF